MEKLKILNKLKDLYEQKVNISSYLKEITRSNNNTIEDIMISYEMQSGSYVKHATENKDFKEKYSAGIFNILSGLTPFSSIMEAGVGEATTLTHVMNNIPGSDYQALGFDLSWSRLKYGEQYLAKYGKRAELFCANLFEIPLPDNAVDVVYTSHSIEPNGGKEKEALTELLRVTNKYLILLEPGYDYANEEAKRRMENFGYCIDLLKTAKSMGLNIIESKLFDISENPLNPTGLIIIEKNKDAKENKEVSLVCPLTKGEFIREDCSLFSSGSLLSYPVIKGIPCLLKENAIITTHFNNF